jgi:dienelactone hydrolase
VHTEDIEYHVDDKRHVGHLAMDRDRQGSRPAVIVCHEGPGLSDHAKNVADRLAELGYVAFALDYHGDGKPLPREEMGARLGVLMGDPDRTRRLAQAGLDVLLAQPTADRSRVAAIGYCFGGTMALELARAGAEVHVVVGFHSGLATARPGAKDIKGSVLTLIGADDPIIPPAQRADFENEMREGGVDWRMVLYGNAGHSFTNPLASSFGMPGIAYHEETDKRSWRAMLDLFEEKFGAF